MTSKHTRTNLEGQNGGRRSTRLASRALLLNSAVLTAALLILAMTSFAAAGQAAQRSYPTPGATFPSAPVQQLPQLPAPAAITPNGKVVEDVVARVNDQIITRSEYERSEQQALQDGQQQGATPAEIQDHLHNLLRDMIDQQLLLSKGKELGITGDAETIRRLDDIRKQNHLDSMEALEKAASAQGVSFEDFKQNIRNSVITQSVVRDEVGRRLNLTRAQEEAYYATHSKEFEVPEQVHLSEILVPTPENATEAQLATAQAKADAVAAKLKAGAKFADLAKSDSGGPTASAGGDLGDFQRGKLGQVLEDATFPLPVGGNTAPIRTRQGFVILHVDAHQAAGVPPVSAIEPQLEEAIYLEQLQPALRAYLTKARQDAYVEIAPGFVDSGSATKTNNANFAYTAYSAPAVKKKIQAKQRMEQDKAAKAQAALAAARERVAEKQAAKAEADAQKLSAAPGKKSASAKPMKQKKIPREKIRYGQAPRNALPRAAVAESTPANVPGGDGVLPGQAPGVAMAPTESITSITTGVGADSSSDSDPLAQAEGPTKKTRFSAHETQAEVDRAKAKLGKAETKATIRPVVATQTQSASEKQQAAPLGLNGDMEKKKRKPKRKKGDEKERLQEQAKPAPTPAPIAPTVNPALAGTPAAASPATSSAPPQ